MQIEEKRAILRLQYKGAKKWVDRVNKMSDNQVLAVYFRMLNSGQLRYAKLY